jgi:hypothetical protein
MKLVRKLKAATRRPVDPVGRTPRCDESAYLALEAARPVCERHQAGDQQHQDRLRLLHRHLGMAGFYASSELRAARRRELLELARERSEERSTAAVDLAFSIAAWTRDARSDIEEAMKALGPRDDLHLTHLYVLGAVELLAAWAPRVEAIGERSRAA